MARVPYREGAPLRQGRSAGMLPTPDSNLILKPGKVEIDKSKPDGKESGSIRGGTVIQSEPEIIR